MLTSRLYRIFILGGILSLVAAYLGVWIRFIHDPEQRTGADFITFYSAGRISQRQGYSHVYEPEAVQELEQEVVGFPLVKGQVLLFNHLPYMLPIYRVLMSEDYVASFYRWLILMLLLYLAAFLVLSRWLQQSGIDRSSATVIGISAFLFLPLFFSLMNGQDTALLFLGAALWMYGLSAKREAVAGLGLSLTTIRPHISLMLAIPLLFRNYRAFLWYVIGASVLAITSIVVIGVDGVYNYLHILRISAGGEWHGMKEEAMFNLIGLLTRLFPGVARPSLRLVAWIVYGVTVIGLAFFWKYSKSNLAIGLTTVVALFTVPHLHFHDLTLLLIPFYEFTQQRVFKTTTATVLPIAASLLLLLSNGSPYLEYTVPYLLMAGMILFPYSLERKAVPT